MALPRPAFILGVTGKMKLPGYNPAISAHDASAPEIQELRNRVFAVLDWVRERHGALNPITGDFETTPSDETPKWWHSLGIHDTPIVVLSSLAPGADTIVAEAALDYAHQHQANVTVRAPLPFPLELYRQSTSFCPTPKDEEENEDERLQRELLWALHQQRLDALVTRIRGQLNFCEARDLFCVDLDNDLIGNPQNDLTDPFRRRLRYRAAGEFVATYSDVLLAIDDAPNSTAAKPNAYDLSARPGTELIIETKRLGLTYELLAVANNFAWADNGPVLRLPLSVKDGQDRFAFLHPYDTMPRHESRRPVWERCLLVLGMRRQPSQMAHATVSSRPMPDGDPAWQETGDALFRRILRSQNEFNQLHKHDREDSELLNLLGQRPGDVKAGLELGPLATKYVRQLNELAMVRRRAASHSVALDSKRESLLKRLLWFIFLAAVFLGLYENAAEATGHEDGWLVTSAIGKQRALFVFGALLCLLASGLQYWRYLRSDAERKRYDWRAIGEGLRVQFYWCVTGLHSSVAANYMQRQRGELDWIRYVIASITFPLERWRNGFADLEHSDRVDLLKVVRTMWVKGQRDYYEKTASEDEARAHFWHNWAWTGAAAGVINILGKFLAEASPPFHHALEEHHDAIALGMASLGVLLLMVALWGSMKSSHGTKHDHGPVRSFLRWILLRPLRWGWALIIGAAVLTLPHHLAHVSDTWHGFHPWWIILTGIVLLGGGLCMAWTERSFHSESARQNRAMTGLYDCAERRLDALLERYAALPDGTAESDRTLAEIRHIFFELGCEALDENAEWLILHRIRPLEPFMAG